VLPGSVPPTRVVPVSETTSLVVEARMAPDASSDAMNSRLKPGASGCAFDHNLPGLGNHRLPLERGNLVLLHQKVRSHGQLPDDLVFPRFYQAEIKVYVFVEDAELLPVERLVIKLRIQQESLGRNAAPVETSPSELAVLFNQRDLQPELARLYGRNIASRSTTDYCNVKENRLCAQVSPSHLLDSPFSKA